MIGKPKRPKWTATRVDLIFGSHFAAARFGGGLWQRRRKREVGAKDFVAAWNKVMNADRFDLVYRAAA